MKPNFALNLSHEGISLLHRSGSGWTRVGDVALDDRDLTEQLQVLRRTAADLENGGLTSKLVIPNSQILYTDIVAPGPDTAARITQIRDGLVGLTPYDVNELVFDWRMDGDRAHVAVVARDTLQEAENFAVEYRFNPVCFVAVPTDGPFDGEPYFGPSRHAASLLQDGESIERDEDRIVVVGSESGGFRKSRRRSKPKAAPEAQSDHEGTDAPTKGADAATPQTETAVAPPAGDDDRRVAETPQGSPDPSQDDTDTSGTPPEAAPTFASRRAHRAGDAPEANRSASVEAEGQDDRREAASPPPAPSVNADAEPASEGWSGAGISANSLYQGTTGASEAAPIEIDLYADRKPKPVTRPAPPASRTKAGSVSAKPAAPPPAARGPDRTPMPMTSPHTADVIDPSEKSAERRRQAKELAKETTKTASSALADGLGRLGRSTAESARKLRAKADQRNASKSVDTIGAAEHERQGAPATGAKPKSTEVEAMTVFGARGRAPQRGKPRYLGLILTLLLLLALAVLALWSTYFMNDLTSGWFGRIDDDTELAAPAVLPQPVDPDPATPAETVTVPSPVIPNAGEIETVEIDTPTSPIDTAVAEALDGDETPETPVPVEQPEIAALPEPVPDPVIAEPVTPPTSAETPAEPEAETPEVAETVIPEPIVTAPVRQPPPTRAEAEAKYAATGIWQLDPVPPADVPGGGDRLEDVYVASIDPVIGSTDAFALPSTRSLITDVLPPVLNPPPPLGTQFDFDERGLVRATSEGAVTPDGVQVFSGPPDVVPGPRPADLEVPVDETRLIEDERLRALRPTLRPGNVSEANERARLGGFSAVELAGIRPTVRPLELNATRAALILPLVEEPATDSGTSVADTNAESETETSRGLPAPVALAATTTTPPVNDETATELAVLASYAPRTRPTDFAGVVQQALAEAQAEAQAEEEEDAVSEAVAAAVAASVAPLSPTIPAPVARPKTVLTTAAVAPARAPTIPTRASVAQNATVRNAISLNKVNLIGVYGSSTDRRALVRLRTGRYVKVKVGDRVDGGQVATIGEGELRYVKGGRNITLTMPRG